MLEKRKTLRTQTGLRRSKRICPRGGGKEAFFFRHLLTKERALTRRVYPKKRVVRQAEARGSYYGGKNAMWTSTEESFLTRRTPPIARKGERICPFSNEVLRGEGGEDGILFLRGKEEEGGSLPLKKRGVT